MKKVILVIASFLLLPIIASTVQFMCNKPIVDVIKMGLAADMVLVIIFIYVIIVFWATGAKQKMDDLL